MRLKDIPWRDLTCPALRVSVTLENRGENGIEAICQTNCEDALTFSWILPNGEHSSSSYEYSTNSTHIRTVTCKGSDVDISETKRMCSSVLNIPDKTIAGNSNYTCIVTTNYTNPAMASVVLRFSNATDNVRRPVSEGNDGQGVTVETHYENDDQFPETNPDRHYENDDQFPETNGGTNPDGHYENEDQFPDANPDTVKHYENTDQNREESSDGQYENEMKANAAFQTCEVYGASDADNGHDKNTPETHYENDDQFSDPCIKDTDRHYENDDQFPKRNQDMDSNSSNQFPGAKERRDLEQSKEETSDGHYDNEMKAKSAFKTSQVYKTSGPQERLEPAGYNADIAKEQQELTKEVEGLVAAPPSGGK
ncbi:corticospinal neuron axon guidance through spinal cord [Branchiostoma belcheri]|nr:corticospinal neuron axon guidance through spinal cord [Branchiostoma belcheri]